MEMPEKMPTGRSRVPADATGGSVILMAAAGSAVVRETL